METDKAQASVWQALIEARAEMRNVSHTRENEFLSSRFAPLDAVIDAICPVLAKHGLMLSTETTFEPVPVGELYAGFVVCKTCLIHESGRVAEYTKRMPVSFARKGLSIEQCVGVAQTYARRTQFLEIAGLHATSDLDADDISTTEQKTVAALSPEQLEKVRAALEPAGMQEYEVADAMGVGSLEKVAAVDFPRVMRALTQRTKTKE